jgi:hypothetical protein
LQCRLWQPGGLAGPDGDGISQPNEVSSLAQLGVVSISLSSTPANTAVGDDLIIATATAMMADGSTRQIAEAVLDTDPTYSRYVGNYTPDPSTESLPQLKGYGLLPDLSIAMSQDTGLKTLVQAPLPNSRCWQCQN